MQFHAVATSAFKAGSCNFFEACRVFLHRLMQDLCLFWRGFQLYNKCSIHAQSISYRRKYSNGQAFFLPAGSHFFLPPDGKIAGFCRAIPALLPTVAEDFGGTLTDVIEQPGVVPEHRHRDLYHCLVLLAMHWLRARGQHAVMLQSWGDDGQTIALYQKMGFLLRQRFLAYHYELEEF
jgi:ribosomal protein S18 acetylase RimI-like enzyme